MCKVLDLIIYLHVSVSVCVFCMKQLCPSHVLSHGVSGNLFLYPLCLFKGLCVNERGFSVKETS